MDKKQKVAMILRNACHGGVENVKFKLKSYLINKNWDVDFIFFHRSGPMLNSFKEGAQCFELIGTNSFKKNPFKFLLAIYRLRKYILENNPDILISSKEQANLVNIACKLFMRHKIPVVLSRHASLSSEDGNDETSRFVVLLYKYIYRFADGVVAVCKELANDIIEIMGDRHREKVRYIYNPIFTDDFQLRSLSRPNVPFDSMKKYVLGVGRLSHMKGFDVFIEAIKKVRTQHDVHGVILGEGPLRGELEKLIDDLELRECVHLLGHVNNVYAYMKYAAVFALPSRWEGLCSALVEAAAVGVPIACSRHRTGAVELLEMGATYTLFDVDSSSQLAEAISSMIDKKASALPINTTRFTYSYAGGECVKYFEELCARKRKRPSRVDA